VVVKNPAPPNVPIERVVQQTSNFLSAAMNLKTYPTETGVKAVGQVMTMPSSQVGFPSNPNEMQNPENVPLMIEAQFYPDI